MPRPLCRRPRPRSDAHTSELQSLLPLFFLTPCSADRLVPVRSLPRLYAVLVRGSRGGARAVDNRVDDRGGDRRYADVRAHPPGRGVADGALSRLDLLRRDAHVRHPPAQPQCRDPCVAVLDHPDRALMAAAPARSPTRPPIGYWRWVRSEEHTSELQSLLRISYAVFCLKTKKKQP